MSVERLMELSKLFDECHEKPEAWLIRARPLDQQPTVLLPIALFDTKEQAEAYIQSVRLPAPVTRADGVKLFFLRESALGLVDYIDKSGTIHGHSAVIPAFPENDYGDVPQNPVPPSHIEIVIG